MRRWRFNVCLASARVASFSTFWAFTLASVASAVRRSYCWVMESISATRSPFFTFWPSATFNEVIRPETWAPTATSLTGLRSPVARTLSSTSPLVTTAVMMLGLSSARKRSR